MQSPRYQLVHLRNGATSVRSLEAAETFHPVVGPVAEAEALYVNQLQLRERIKNHTGKFVIWDVGLGAAANTLTALRATREMPCQLRLVSFDHTLEPLEFALQHAAALGYFGGYEGHVQHLLRDRQVAFQDGPQSVKWELRLGDFPTLLANAVDRQTLKRHALAESTRPQPLRGGEPRPTRPQTSSPPGRGQGWVHGPNARSLPEVEASQEPAESEFGAPPHAILFDAYSPARNPAMWTRPLFSNLFRLLDPQRPCALPTYSRSTILRVTLLLAGFYVGVGHATGEKPETTIAANTLALLSEPLDRRWLDRAHRSHSAEPMMEAVYRTAPLSPESWERLQAHPQFVS